VSIKIVCIHYFQMQIRLIQYQQLKEPGAFAYHEEGGAKHQIPNKDVQQ
jgi:hypothetical protein